MHRDQVKVKPKKTQKHDALRQRNYRLKRQQILDRQREYLAKYMYRRKQKNTKNEPKDFQNRTPKARAMKN